MFISIQSKLSYNITIMTFNAAQIRLDFPILHQEVNGYPLIYMDNAASTQKPHPVIDSLTKYYQTINANIHRGNHALADEATATYESTRRQVQKFINANHVEEIIFTKGTTDSINTIANVFAKKYLKQDSEIIISTLEHHSNIVPWQIACSENGAKLKIIPIADNGELDLESFRNLLSPKTVLVALNHISNTLGIINPVEQIIALAHQNNTPVLLDGAQAVGHLQVDVQALDCDFYAFSSHKIYGPTGVGVLYGKRKYLEAMPPYQSGGEMIKEVSFERTTYNELPYKYEAGTPNIAGVIALKAALEYVENLNREEVLTYETELLDYVNRGLKTIAKLKIWGDVKPKTCITSFTIEGIHHYDLGTLLDAKGIAIRTGHHCTQPLMNRFGIDGTARVSLTMYNTKSEIDYLIEAIEKSVIQLL